MEVFVYYLVIQIHLAYSFYLVFFLQRNDSLKNLKVLDIKENSLTNGGSDHTPWSKGYYEGITSKF